MHQVSIQNFQSHKDTRISLSPTVNSLEGVSDSGKSAALRAMLWALTNRPDGTAFASYWAKDKKGKLRGQVSVSIDNITRVRSEEFNGYIRYGASGEERYEALKGAVPVEIERAINMGPVNIQRQMDPPFLLSSTPGDAARYLNSLVGLEEIDVYQKALKGKSRDTANSLKDEESRLAEAEDRLSKYNWVDAAKEKVSGLEKACAFVETLVSDLAALSALDEHSRCDPSLLKTRLDAAERLISEYPNTDSLYADLSALGGIAQVADTASRIERTRIAVESADPLIDALAHMDTTALNNAFNLLSTALFDVTGITTRLQGETGRIGAVNALIDQGTCTSAVVSDSVAAISAIMEAEGLSRNIDEASHALIETSAFLEGKACPVCGKPL